MKIDPTSGFGKIYFVFVLLLFVVVVGGGHSLLLEGYRKWRTGKT